MSLDELLAMSCAPALAGIKAANLVSCCFRQYPNIEDDIQALNEKLNNAGIFFEIIAKSDTRLLLFVYRQNSLQKTLHREDVKAYLRDNGYPIEEDIHLILAYLKNRFSEKGDFPHEIGVFLGYPIEDIKGFLQHKGNNFKLCGYWKVYSDKEEAEKLFERFTKCRKSVYKRITNGASIVNLFCVS